MNDLWKWISEKLEAYQRARDYERYSMTYGFQYGMNFMKDDPAQALELLEQTRNRAEALGESWWVYLCDHWRCQTMLHYSGEVAEAGEMASRCIDVVDIERQFSQFPQRVCLHDDRATARQWTDPAGYAEEISADCDYIEREGKDLEGCLHCGRLLRVDQAILRGHVDEADRLSLAGLGRCRSSVSSHYVPQYAAALCRTARVREDWARLRHWASAGEQYHGKMGSNLSNVELLMWHAVALAGSGASRSEVRASYLRAVRAAREKSHPQTTGYYDALADFHTLIGRPGASIVAHQRQIDARPTAAHLECRARLGRLRLMKQIQRPVDEELDLLRTAASRLREPSTVLAEVDEIAGA